MKNWVRFIVLCVVLTLLSNGLPTMLPNLAHAQSPARAPAQAVIDRVDLEPSPLWGSDRLRILFSDVSVQGGLVDIATTKGVRLMVGTSEKKLPMILGHFGKTDIPLAVAIIVQSSLDFSEVLPLVRDNVQTQLLTFRPANTQWMIVSYGDAVNAGKLVPSKSVTNQLDRIASDGSASEPALLEAVERALIALKKTKPSNARKMIIIVGDGRDRENDRAKVTAMGERAAKENVRIHSLAYTPSGARRPLLVLGELSKQSLGTFRWVRTGKQESWQPVFAQLAAEIANQNVLTFFAPNDELAGKKIHIETAGSFELASNEAKIGPARCGDATCDQSQACVANRCSTLAPGVKRQFGKAILYILVGVGVLALLLVGATAARNAAARARIAQPQPQQSQAMQQPVANAAAPVRSAPQKTLMVQTQQPPPAQGSRNPSPGPARAPAPAPQSNAPAPRVSGAAMAAAPVRPAVVAGPPPATLYVLSGPRNGQRLPLHNGFVIGRAPHCQLVIDDPDAEAQHAEIQLDGYGNAAIIDRNTRSGTFVGGSRIRSAALTHGSSIRIGSTDLRYLAE